MQENAKTKLIWDKCDFFLCLFQIGKKMSLKFGQI